MLRASMADRKTSPAPSSAPAARLPRRIGAPVGVAARLGWRFSRYVVLRFLDDDGLRLAAGLSYTSLLALVPMIAIALAILAAFPAFDEAREQLRQAVYALFPPGGQVDIGSHYDAFLRNASELTAPGVVGLAVTALLLLNNIDAVLSKIFREAEPRSAALRFLVYWAMLTLGPLLIGASLSLSSYVFALAQLGGFGEFAGGAVIASRLAAIALAALGFALIYLVVPHRPVAWAHALAGGLVAALLLELLKYVFGLYIAHFRAYEALYGALAALPVFLLWLYLAWSVVLLGAEAAAGLPEWRYAAARGATLSRPGEKLALGLAVLERLQAAAEDGRRVTQAGLHRGLPATPTEVDLLVSRLKRARIVERANRGRVLLARDLRHLNFAELLEALEVAPAPQRRWPGAAGAAAERYAALSGELARTPLAELLETRADGPAERPEPAGTPAAALRDRVRG